MQFKQQLDVQMQLLLDDMASWHPSPGGLQCKVTPRRTVPTLRKRILLGDVMGLQSGNLLHKGTPRLGEKIGAGESEAVFWVGDLQLDGAGLVQPPRFSVSRAQLGDLQDLPTLEITGPLARSPPVTNNMKALEYQQLKI